MAREHNATSLADLIASRLGKDSWLAAMVTAVTVIGMIPYIALQLKAVAMSHGLLTRTSSLSPPPWQDSALYVALARSEEHTSELQSLMRISYAVFCLKKKKK